MTEYELVTLAARTTALRISELGIWIAAAHVAVALIVGASQIAVVWYGIRAMQQAAQAELDKRDELLDRAIAEFRAILVARPNLVRVCLELARAFFLKGDDSLARRQFEIVLAGKPPAPRPVPTGSSAA